MFLERNKIKKTKLTILALLVFVLSIICVQPALALNGGSGTKAYNFDGYRYLDTHNIEVWVDKSPKTVTASQVRIYHGSDASGQVLQIQGVTSASGSNITGVSGLPGGGVEKITTSDAFVPGELYTVVLSRTIQANNLACLGSYGDKDVSFSFTAPDVPKIPNGSGGSGEYSSSAQGVLTLYPQNNATNVPVENNIGFAVNVPVSNYNDVKAGLVLSMNGVPLKLDPSINSTKDGDIYAPLVTDDHTLFFFPMTGGGSAVSYNLAFGSEYELTIPAITLVNGQTIPGQTITFTTVANDPPAMVSSAPNAVNTVDGNVTITWTDPTGTTGYNVYASEDPYWNFAKLNASPITGTSFTTSGLKPNTAYYFRVASLNGGSEALFSNYVLATTPADTTPPVITLQGDATVNVANGATYTDAGATVTDNYDTGLTAIVTYTKDGNSVASVDTSAAGTYIIHYNASDAAGNAAAEVTRTVIVAEPIALPTVTLDNNVIYNTANPNYVIMKILGTFTVPAGYQMTDAGFVSVKNVADPGTSLTKQTTNATIVRATVMNNAGQVYRQIMTTYGATFYVRGYITYVNTATGATGTIYSNVVKGVHN